MTIVELARARAESGSDSAPAEPAATRVGGWVLLGIIVVAGAALRIVWSTSLGLSFDETFTAMAGRRSVGGMLDYLASTDSHPPLDYLLRMPLARAGASDLALRAPSIVFSVAALALLAWWMRERGIAGAVATGLMAVSGFAIAYGSEARMYALLQLVGVAAAMTAEGWLRAPRPVHSWIAGALVFVGCLDHTSTFLLAGGLVVLAGLRTDRDAWRWRLGVSLGVLAWVPFWGPSIVRQLEGSHSSWIPPTSARGFVDAVVSQVTFTDGVTWLVAAAVVVGAICLARSDRRLFRVWIACAAVPFVAAAAIGLVTPFFLNRTLTLELWAPVLAVGMLVEHVWRRSAMIGGVTVVLLALIALPGTLTLLGGTWEYDISIGRIEASARPGDVVAVVPSWYEQVVDWRIGVRAPLGRTEHVTLAGVPDAEALVVTGAPRTGRVWLLEYSVARPSLAGYDRCAPTWTYGESRLLCLVAAGAPT
jgi:mannosyltransferase